MDDLTKPTKTTQAIVYFDVSGTIFRVLRETIRRYPASLLARLVDEFPTLGYESQPIFIDRSPSSFEWILEIYRNGRYETLAPELSYSELKRELDFYQLKNIQEVETGLVGTGDFEIEAASKWCGKLLVDELTKQNLWKDLPLYVWFYRQKNEGEQSFGEECVAFRHTTMGAPAHTMDGKYEAFFWVLHCNRTMLSEVLDPWILFEDMTAHDTQYLIRNVRNETVRKLLVNGAAASGLDLHVPEDGNLHANKMILSIKFFET
eukprot:g2229.t1